MQRRIPTLALLAICAMAFHAGPARAIETSPTLTLDDARKMAAACEAMSKTKGWRMNIVVVDSGARPILFERMDRSYLGSGDIALMKAQTSGNFPFSTRLVGELNFGKDGKPAAIPGLALIPGVVAFAGGLPVFAGKTHIGGIGVSGGSADEDEVCAQAGIDAIKDRLK